MTLNFDIPRTVRDPAGIVEHFASLSDPRREQGRLHLLEEIIFVALCAVLLRRRQLAGDRRLWRIQERLVEDLLDVAGGRPLA